MKGTVESSGQGSRIHLKVTCEGIVDSPYNLTDETVQGKDVEEVVLKSLVAKLNEAKANIAQFDAQLEQLVRVPWPKNHHLQSPG